jgi:hypothetical protein
VRAIVVDKQARDDTNDIRRKMSTKSIVRILLEKCGDEPPTGHYDDSRVWDGAYYPPFEHHHIKPFQYSKKKDIICLTTWEGGYYSINYVNIPEELAGIPLIFTRVDHFYKPCDYHNKGSVYMYKTQTGIVRAIEARLRRGLRHMACRWLARKYAQKALSHDIGSYISTFI